MMKFRLQGAVIAAMAALFIVMAAVGAGSVMAADTIKLGVAGAHSGDLASYGIPSVRAAELVVKDINAKGGVLGKQGELVVEADVCKPEVPTNPATKLVGEGVNAVLATSAAGPPRPPWGSTRTPRSSSCRRRPLTRA